MRPFTSLISAQEALETMMSLAIPMGRTEKVGLEDAPGRVLATDIIAPFDVPPFNRAAMDGYAVIAEDTFGVNSYEPAELKCVDEVFAGDKPHGKVEKGQCIQIATGAPMPESANAVVMVEYTDREGDIVKINKPQVPGGDVSNSGSDIANGDVVVEKGSVLQPASIGAIAAVGIEQVEVYSRPKIMVVPTGNEVIALGEEPEPGKIYDINTHSIAALVTQAGCEAIKTSITEDTAEALEAIVDKALAEGVDMLIFSGGSSVGERDILVDVLGNRGKVLFHGVQIKPGKPTLFGTIENLPVLGLPGYPTSCLTNGYFLLLPMLAKMSRVPHMDKTVEAKMGARVVSTLGRMQIFTVSLEDGTANPVFRESGAITSLARATGYILIPDNTDIVEKGETVMVHLI